LGWGEGEVVCLVGVAELEKSWLGV